MYSEKLKQIILKATLTIPKNGLSSRTLILKPYKNEIINSTSFLPPGTRLIERVYCILYNIISPVKCKNCLTKNTKYNILGGLKGYKSFCSIKCSNRYNINKRKQTCLAKYGVDNPFKLKEIQNQCQITNPFKTKEGQLKAKESMIEKYGTSIPLQNKQIQNKQQQTNLEKYGYKNAAKNEIIKQKILSNRFGTKLTCNIGKNEKSLLDKQEQIDNCIINRSFIIGPYRPDGYCYETNTVYEVYEKFHKQNKHQQKDEQRQKYIKEQLNCNFIVIWDC